VAELYELRRVRTEQIGLAVSASVES
jgi:hypothetical protein